MFSPVQFRDGDINNVWKSGMMPHLIAKVLCIGTASIFAYWVLSRP
jgi:hypothetical protein